MSKNVWVKVMYVVVPLIALALGVVIGAAAFGGKDNDKSGDAAASQPATAEATQAPTDGATVAATPSALASVPASVAAPQSATPDGGIAFGKSNAKVVVQVFYDFMCPYCGQLEKANGPDLAALAEDGTIQLVQHPLSFLDRASQGTEYSTRAANAFATAANANPDAALKFATLLFDEQPEENTTGLDDAKIADLAKQAGVPDAAISQFAAKNYVPWVQASTQVAFTSLGITGTPTVLINGEKYTGDPYTAGTLKTAIQQAAG